MDPANLRELFTQNGSGGGGGGGGALPRTVDDILAEMRSVARNNFGGLLDELKAVPEVARAGIAPHKLKELVDLLMDQAGDLDYLGRKGADHLRAAEENDGEGGEVSA